MISINDIDWSTKPDEIQKAAAYYMAHSGKSIKEKIIEILEPHFLEANCFHAGNIFDCDYKYRHFMFNEDMTKYYCTPFPDDPRFIIRKCEEIERAEIVESAGKDGALTGALLFGAAGAIVGKGSKYARLGIKIYTSNINEPYVGIDVMSVLLGKEHKYFKMCLENTEKIYGALCQVIAKKQKSRAGASNDEEVIDRIRKFKVLYDEGIITQEEFEAKKKQLLGI